MERYRRVYHFFEQVARLMYEQLDGALAIQFAKDRNGGDCGTTSSRAWCGGTGIANGVFLGGVAGLFVGLRHPGEQWREVWIR